MSIVSKLLKKKILGVSIGSALGAGGGGLGRAVASKATGNDPLQDLSAGARNAAVIFPFLGKGVSAASSLGDTINPIAAGKGGVPESVMHAPQADPSRFRSIADFIGGHGDDILKYGKAAGDAYGAYRNAKLQDEALGLARGNYNANAPLRDAARAGLLDNSRPDLSGVFADPSNPNGRYRRVNVGSRA